MKVFGKIAHVDLSSRMVSYEEVTQDLIQQTMGGVGLSAWFLFRDVPPSANWMDESNCIIFMSGPLGGTLPGTGIVNVLSKGPMTNLAGSSQANGFFGAFLSFNGLLGIEIHGRSPNWVYILIQEGGLTIEDANRLVGLDTHKTQEELKRLASGNDVSVACIGPAGEKQVFFSAVVSDYGHVAAHNGLGAVMGSKRLKAIAVSKGQFQVPVKNPDVLKNLAKQFHQTVTEVEGGSLIKWGTLGAYERCYKKGQVAIKNLTTSIWPHYVKYTGEAIRNLHRGRVKRCWKCGIHCRWIEVPGLGEIEEPEYEGVVAFGSLIDNPDVEGAIKLCNLVDNLGLDVNEAGWLVAWAMECYTNGLISTKDLDGIEINWGSIENTAKLLEMVAYRTGCGDWLAEGVMRAARRIGGAAVCAAVGTERGATLRTHDFRAKWAELLDTCVSTTSTLEAVGGHMNLKEVGIEPGKDPFDYREIARANAQQNGWRIFDDSCPICRFYSTRLPLTVGGVNAVTGWDLSPQDALRIGKRTINRLRVFNLLHGASPDQEQPSERCTRAPTDGPCEGLSVASDFKEMKQLYWREMGWEEATGKPLAKTLIDLGLDHECKLLRSE